MGYGQNGHVGISFQNSMGTSNVDSMDYFPIISESITESIESLVPESLQSRYEEPDDYEGMHSIEGDIVCEVHPHLVGKALKAWCGQHSQDIYVNSCYRHLFIPCMSDWDVGYAALPPMTIEVYRDAGSAYLYYDCMCNQLVFEIAQNALYKMTMSIIGTRFAWANKTTPSYLPGSYFPWDTTSISLGGTAITNASQMTVTLNNNLATKAYLDGNKYPARILRDGYRTVEIAGTVLFDSGAQANNWRNRTQQQLLLVATDPATVMGYHNLMTFDVPQMRYTDFPANIGGMGLIEVGFSATGRWDQNSNYAFEAVLVNTATAY